MGVAVHFSSLVILSIHMPRQSYIALHADRFLNEKVQKPLFSAQLACLLWGPV